MADLVLLKSNIDNFLTFDLELIMNDFQSDNSIYTATIISVFTDSSKPYIGDFLDNPIKLGNVNYNVDRLTPENVRLYKQGLEKSLQWLIDDNIVVSNNITVTKRSNKLDIIINQIVDTDNKLNLIYSLDQNLEILDDNITRS